VLSHSREAVEEQVAAEVAAHEENLDYAETLPVAEENRYLEVIGAAAPTEPAEAGKPANCQEAAAASIVEPAMQAQVTLAERSVEVGAAVEARPEVKQAEALWSRCMRGAGYDYGNPAQPEQEIVSALVDSATVPDLDALLVQEATVAEADSDCRESTGYMQTVEKAAVEEWRAADIDMETINTAAGAVQ
jgi:hypothetical protein